MLTLSPTLDLVLITNGCFPHRLAWSLHGLTFLSSDVSLHGLGNIHWISLLLGLYLVFVFGVLQIGAEVWSRFLSIDLHGSRSYFLF